MYLKGRCPSLLCWLFIITLNCTSCFEIQMFAEFFEKDGAELDEILSQVADTGTGFSRKWKIVDENGDELFRECSNLGTISDKDFDSLFDGGIATLNISQIEQQVPKTCKSCDSSRGSLKPINEKGPKPFPHKPSDGDLKGCGNPVCVVIDRKPRRFKSLCNFNQFMQTERPGDQINFVQKGDCYEIIDNKDGARDKPWVSQYPVLQMADCEKCKKDEFCGKPVVINVDLSSVIHGQSTALGGDIFHPETNKRMAGVPMEFPTVCDAMLFFQTRTNLNIKTQVIGYGVGYKKWLYPLDGDKCLWTEWFNHNDPCSSTGDDEVLSSHISYLENSQTSSLRICHPEDITDTQQQGGSEVTRLSVDDLIRGLGQGFDTNTTFGQVLTKTKTRITCNNTKQTESVPGELPPPFLYAQDLGVKCLDYKQRYCCKSTSLYRPQKLDMFSRYIPVAIPIGPTSFIVERRTNKKITQIKFGISNIYGKPIQVLSVLKIESAGPASKDTQNISFTGDLQSAVEYLTPISGRMALRVLKNGETHLELTLNTKIDDKIKTFAEIKVVLDKDDNPLQTIVNCLITQGSSETKYNKYGEKGTFTARVKPATGEVIDIILGNKFEIIESTLAKGGERIAKEPPFWEQVQTLNNEIRFDYFIESPPLESLFAECQWKDFVNSDYPSKQRTGIETEIRQIIGKNRKMSKTVCGDIPENAHFIDAVTVEDNKPWCELMAGGGPYQVFKLSPFFGYACNDENIQSKCGKTKCDRKPAVCKDMKIRFCCAKKMRAQWAEWGEWDKCSRTCGGGDQRRYRSCNIRDETQESCFGINANEEDRIRYTEQKRKCQVQNCPVDFAWTSWSSWSGCTVSCGNGYMKRYRTCSPGVGGGANCPDKVKEKDLFKEEEACAATDCDTFHETPWSQWSQVSVTCGEGAKSRKRQCASLKTLAIVTDRKCAKPGEVIVSGHFQQTERSKLRDCPVDGGWTEWQYWQPCSQNCIYPQTEEGINRTKAVQKRFKHCSNPIRAYGGKKCKKVAGYKYLSHENALEQTKPCKSQEDGGNVPLCPVNCVFSDWSAWSQCSATCIARGQLNYHPSADLALEYPADIRIINSDASTGMLPKRTRRSCILKPAKYGGECPQLDLVPGNWKLNARKDQPYVEQTQDCTLAKEHCVNSEINPHSADQFKWPKLRYPGDDPRAVGYCPIDCTWGGSTRTYCEKAQEELFKDFENDPRCYTLKVLYEAKPSEQKKLFDDIVERIKSKKIVEFEEDVQEPESMKRVRKRSCRSRRSRPCRRVKKVIAAFQDDIANIWRFTTRVTVRQVNLPNIDGLYGGQPCRRASDGATLTKYDTRTDDEYSDGEGSEEYETDKEKGGPHFGSDDRIEEIGACDLQICQPPEKGVGFVIPCISIWSEWGKWSKCDKKCGDEGSRRRKRKCVDACHPHTEDAGECREAVLSYLNKTVSGTDKTVCSPCPPDSSGQWSQWGDWKGDGYGCSDEAGAMQVLTRKRKCIEGPVSKKCFPTAAGKITGVDKEVREVPLPKCLNTFASGLPLANPLT